MENRASVTADYFKLRLLLNRTNLARNQKTEMVFEVLNYDEESYRLVATLKGVKNPKHIELCKTNKAKRWVTSNYSGLFAIEEYTVQYLQDRLTPTDNLEKIRSIVQKIHFELRSLGIPL